MKLPFTFAPKSARLFIHSLPGGKVLLEMTPYDLTRERSSLREK
jgi:translation initiation factor IF-1